MATALLLEVCCAGDPSDELVLPHDFMKPKQRLFNWEATIKKSIG